MDVQKQIKGNVLVVDDESANIFYLEGLLTEEDYHTITAENGKEALIKLDENAIDLILLDIMMPEMSGLEVLDNVLANDKTKDIPVIMVTAKTEAQDVEEAMNKGAVDYIKKPFNDLELLARTKTAIKLKKQEDKLRQMVESKEQFIRTVSHDLRTPFTSISEFANILLNDEEMQKRLSDENREILQLINQSTEYLVNYFNKLLNWARSESKNFELKISEIDLNKLVNTSYLIFKDKLNKKNIAFETNIPEGLKLQADETFFNQVISNLIGNAVKYTPEGGTIKITAIEEDNNVTIKVADTGIGITDVSPEELFGQAYHTSTPGTNKEKGTGLGLHICKNILDAHSFSITFESEKDKGTTFIINTNK
jgi:two-component system sensor histidine kinase/response regulator